MNIRDTTEGKVLFSVVKYPYFRNKDNKERYKEIQEIYNKYYLICLSERLADFYAGYRLFSIGYSMNNDSFKYDGLKRIYRALLRGYEEDDKGEFTINIDNKLIYAPTIRYFKELMKLDDKNSKKVFDDIITERLDEGEKIKLGLVVDDVFLNKSKNYYQKLLRG